MSRSSRHSLWAAARAARRRRDAGIDDSGFTLVEMTVTLAVLTIVFGLTFGLIVGLQQQQVNLRATVAGSQQAQLASTEVVSYLRAAASVSIATPTEVAVSSYIGTPAGSTSPTAATVTMNYTTTGSILKGTGILDVTFAGSQATRTVASYYVLSSTGTPYFTYYEYGANGALAAMSDTSSVSAACRPLIVAVGLNISFFAGPSDTPSRGYAANVATTLNTEVFLRNVSEVYGSTTTSVASSTTTTVPTCTGS